MSVVDSLKRTHAASRAGRVPLSWNIAVVGVLFAATTLLTAYPLTLLIIRSFQVGRPGAALTWGFDGWIRAFSDITTVQAFLNTLFIGAIRVPISVGLAAFFAWVVTRTDTPGRGILEFFLWLGFFFPLLPLTLGWILLLDPFSGLLNKALVATFQLATAPIDIYSYAGIVWVHLASTTSVLFILLTPSFRAMDALLEEAARTSGSSNVGTFFRITLPVLTPAILAVFTLSFIRSLEAFEVELVLGTPSRIEVFATKLYQFIHVDPPRFAEATALSVVCVLIIAGLIWFQRVVIGRRQFTTVSGKGHSVQPARLGTWRWLVFGLSVTYIVVMVFLPLGALIAGTLMRLFGHLELANPWTTIHWTQAFSDPILLAALRNTLVLGVGAGVLGALFYGLLSYVLVRGRFTGRVILEFFTFLPWAFPGILVSLALLWAVLGSAGFLRALYGTMFLLVVAIIVKEMPLGTQMVRASVLQIGTELEESAWASRASKATAYRTIMLPLLAPALTAVGLITFISAVREIPAVIFLATSGSQTLAVLMLDYIVDGEMEKAAVIGVFISLIITVAALIGHRIGLKIGMRQ